MAPWSNESTARCAYPRTDIFIALLCASSSYRADSFKPACRGYTSLSSLVYEQSFTPNHDSLHFCWRHSHCVVYIFGRRCPSNVNRWCAVTAELLRSTEEVKHVKHENTCVVAVLLLDTYCVRITICSELNEQCLQVCRVSGHRINSVPCTDVNHTSVVHRYVCTNTDVK